MKIGILTLPFHINYGGILQAYALQTIIERLGNKVEFISIEDWNSTNRKKFILTTMVSNLHKSISDLKRKKKRSNLLFFIDNDLHIRHYRSFYDIKACDFDTIVVGSDQIWRKLFIPKYENVFLDFAKDWHGLKRISYAASFGVDYLECNDDDLKECSSLLRKFDAVSVRESSGIDICREKFGIEAVETMDPTMLLTDIDYSFFFNINVKDDGKLLCNILDENPHAFRIASSVSNDKGLRLISFSPEKTQEALPSIEAWLKMIAESSFIITDSFHVTVYSILFHKPFVVLKNELAGNTRIESLLSKLGLQNRLLEAKATISYAVSYCRGLKSPDDNTYVLLDKMRTFSINFLRNSLDDGTKGC